MGGTASVPTDPSRTLQVIGAGYSRTGTLSMSLALSKLLDGPVHHGGSQLLGREDSYVKLWTKIFENRHEREKLLPLLREATAGFVAVTDAPANCFVEELLLLYPEAQVVCVTRDVEKWWQSWKAVTQTAGQGFLAWFLAPVPGKRWYPKLVGQFLEQQDEQFGQMTEERLDQHNVWVKRVTPSERFHMMELEDGWAPLCEILGKPVPKEPFPRLNDSEAIQGLELQILKEAGSRWAVIFAAGGILVYGLSKVWA